MNKKELKSKAKLMEPTLRVGKNGITNQVVEEIKKELKKKKLIKVKMLNSIIKGNNKKQLADELAEKTQSTLIDRVGFVAVLYKE